MGKHKKIKDMEPDDVIEETYVGSPDDVLIPHEVEQGLEMAFAEQAVIVLTLDRATGRVNVDATLATPMEAWGMIARALEDASEAVCLPVQTDTSDD